MRIEIGKFTLQSDSYCMWIEEAVQYKGKDGKPKTKIERVAGYSTTFDNLMRSFCRNKVLDSDATSILELLEVLKQTMDDMENFRATAVEKDFKLIARTRKGDE